MESKVKDLSAKVGELQKENNSLKRELSELRNLCEQRALCVFLSLEMLIQIPSLSPDNETLLTVGGFDDLQQS